MYLVRQKASMYCLDWRYFLLLRFHFLQCAYLSRMSAHTFSKTPSTEGKWYDSRAQLAVLEEVITLSLQDLNLKLLCTRSELWRFFCALLYRRSAGLVCFTQASTRPHCCLSQRSHHLIGAEGLSVEGLTDKILTLYWLLSRRSASSLLPFFQCIDPLLHTPSSLMHINPTKGIYCCQAAYELNFSRNSELLNSFFFLEWSYHQDWLHPSETVTKSHADTWGQFPLPPTSWYYLAPHSDVLLLVYFSFLIAQ